jgi:spoIIIJ-associated protein
MNTVETKRQIESQGNDVEAAIASGLRALKVERDVVEIKVLDEGSRGLLGLGSRPARVRLTVKVVAPPPQEEEKEAPQVQPVVSPVVEKAAVEEQELVQEAEPTVSAEAADEEEAELWRFAPVARQTLEELLEKMKVQAQVEEYINSAEDEDDYAKLVLNIRGQDLGVLIGRRGETLDALQYLTRLIVGRELESRVNLVVDVEGYRVRRERSLRQLAERMAERVVSTGHRQVLEPMSPAERRIIHVTLRHHPQVETESVGHGDNRKVTIFLRGSQ